MACGVIYLITNKLNGKQYVGQTTQAFKERIAQHKYHNALYVDHEIHKFGWENFGVEVIEECNTKEQLDEREMFWIAKLDTMAPNGYNLTAGGSGFQGRKHTPKSIAKMSVRAKERMAARTPESRSESARKREANRSPEEKSATARARELAKTPEERAAARRKGWAKKSPAERTDIMKKVWVARKANMAKKKELIQQLIGLLNNLSKKVS